MTKSTFKILSIQDAKAELDQIKLRASVFHQGSDTSIFKPPSENSGRHLYNVHRSIIVQYNPAGEQHMRDRNLQLERRTAELEMITEEAEREAQRLKEEVARLEIDLQVFIRKFRCHRN